MKPKKLLALILSFSMVVTLLTVSPIFGVNASAAGSVCKIGSTEYTSLNAAVSAVKDGETIVMIADTTETSRINPKKDYSFTITDDGNPHTIKLANTKTSSTGGYGRGFQVGNNSYAPTVVIKSSSTGGLTFDGSNNYGVGIVVYNGTLELDGITFENFNNSFSSTVKSSHGGALSVGNGSYSGYVTIKDCDFWDNSAPSGDDIYFHAGSLSFSGKNIVEELYIANSNTIDIDKSFSTDSSIGIYYNNLSLGQKVVTGLITKNNYQCFKVDAEHEIAPVTGVYQVAEERDIVKIGEYTYDSLAEAIEAASDGATIEVVKDFSVGTPLSINKNITITDDGNARNINIYARIDVEADVTLISSSTGKLYINGYKDKDEDECTTTYEGYLFNINSSSAKLTLDSIGVNYCCNGFVNNTYTGATITLRNFDFTSNEINTLYAINSQGYLYLSGKIYITENYHSSSEANLAISLDGFKTIINDDLTGYISVSSDCANGYVFATKDEEADVSLEIFSSDLNWKLKAKSNSSNQLYWYLPEYQVKMNSPVFDNDNGCYTYPDAYISLESTQTVVNLSVDSGYFVLPQSNTISTTKTYGLDNEGDYCSSSSISAGAKYTVLTIYNQNSFETEDLTKFVSSIMFYPENMSAQTLSVSAGKNVSINQAFFGGSTYTISSEKLAWNTAYQIANQNGYHLLEINYREENDIVASYFRQDVWTAGVMQLGAWYWIGDKTTQFATSATTKEGVCGVYTNWNDDEPSPLGDRLMLDSSGKWNSDSSLDEHYYITEEKNETEKLFTAQQKETETTVLRAYDFSYNGDIAMTYFFELGSDIGSNGKIGVFVDNSMINIYSVDEIKAMNIKDSFGNYGIKVNLPAKMIKSKVHFLSYGSDGLIKRSFGITKTYGYGPYEYMTSYIDSFNSDNHNRYDAVFTQDGVNLITGLLNYGAAAQLQFGYKKSDLANIGYEDSEWDNIPSEVSFDESYMNYMQGNSLIKSLALTADSNSKMLVYLDDTVTNVLVDGSSAKILQDEAGKYIEISVNFKNFSHIYTISTGDCTLQINTYKLLELFVNNLKEVDSRRTAYMLYKYAKKSAKYHGEIEVAGSNVEAVVNTAYAYLNKEKNTQYDQYTLLGSYGSRTSSYSGINDYSQSRRQLYLSPEEISSQNISYLDCSSFVYNIYRDAFGNSANEELGLSITGMSTSNMIQVEDYAVKEYYIYSDEYDYTLDDILTYIQPGDWLVYYKKGGHVMFWTGTGFIHSTSSSIVSEISSGGSYSYTSYFNGYDNTEAGGAVHYVTIDEMRANPDTFFGKHYNGGLRVKVLRPLNALSGVSLTDNAKARGQLGGLGVEITAKDTTKSVDLYRGQSVVTGDEITYTLVISNKIFTGNILTPDRTVDISYSLPTGLTATAATGGKVYGDTVMWSNVAILAGETMTLTFKATVTASAGTTLAEGSGKISLVSAGQNAAPLSFSHREINVDAKVDSSTYNTIKSSTAKTGITGGIDFVSEFFSSLGYSFDISEEDVYGNSTGILKSYSSGYYRVNWNATKRAYISDKMVGGRFVANVSTQDSITKPRNITVDNLQIGDVIIVYDGANSVTYYWIYIGNNYIIQTYSASTSAKKVKASTKLELLNDADYYVVLRVLGR